MGINHPPVVHPVGSSTVGRNHCPAISLERGIYAIIRVHEIPSVHSISFAFGPDPFLRTSGQREPMGIGLVAPLAGKGRGGSRCLEKHGCLFPFYAGRAFCLSPASLVDSVFVRMPCRGCGDSAKHASRTMASVDRHSLRVTGC